MGLLFVCRFCLLLNFLVCHAYVPANSFNTSVQPRCHDDDTSALLQFKQSFVIDKNASVSYRAYPKVLTWRLEGEGSNCCLWDGVYCDAKTGHVIGLNLASSCLFGSFDSNSSLFRLAHLQKLCLADNHFNYSRIPSAFRKLSDLTYLDLSHSYFAGQIPHEISHLYKLTHLDLSYNYETYSGEKLLELRSPNLRNLVQNLTRLEALNLGFVDASSQVPDFLANFSFLRWLVLENCSLHGEFPAKIFKLPNLLALDLQMNKNLSGVLPEFVEPSPLKWLLLYNTSFSGTIPSSIEKLGSLYELCVRACNFSGPIPSSLGKLSQLSILDLGENRFSGGIPSSLQNITKLTILYLAANHLTSPIPPWIGNLTQLARIHLDCNQLHGSIPHSLSKLMNLQFLYLHNNTLSGAVEFDMFFDMKSLAHLDLCRNNLSLHFESGNKNASLSKFKCVALCGCNLNEFPHFLRYQTKLEWLELSGNKIRGQVPKWMWNATMENLLMMDLSYNFLTGFQKHPLVILPRSSLRWVGLGSNMLQGPLPIPPPSTRHFDISNNRFSGEISPLICYLSFLWILDLSNNSFHGAIPRCLGNFSNYLTVLNFGNNFFGGLISLAFTHSSKLRMLDLSHNQFEGQLPRSLANCSMLESLDLKNNQLVDVFPTWLGTLPELKHLILRKNQFYGVIGKPEKILDPFPKLRVIDLSCNYFVGELPFELISNWTAMKTCFTFNSSYMKALEIVDMEGRYSSFYNDYPYSFEIVNKRVETNYAKIQEAFAAIDLSSNKFSGRIPEIIRNLNGLHSLNLSNNMLTGSIPSSVGDLTQLESLDLSQNMLSGEIPRQLIQLNFLESFNVSHNNLMGPIPQGNQLRTFDQSSFKSNLGLCGDPLPKKCGDSEAMPPPPSASDEEDDDDSGLSIKMLDWKFVLAGAISGFVVGVALGDMVITRRRGWFHRAFRRTPPRMEIRQLRN